LHKSADFGKTADVANFDEFDDSAENTYDVDDHEGRIV